MLGGLDRQLQGNFQARDVNISQGYRTSLCAYFRDESPSTSFDTNPSRCAPDWSRTSTTPVTLMKGETRNSASRAQGYGSEGGREESRMMKRVHSRLGRNSRRSTPLRGVTTTRLTTGRRERGIASPETVPIGLTGKHRREDGSNDDQEGQSKYRESMHGGDVSWVEEGYPGRKQRFMARDYKWKGARALRDAPDGKIRISKNGAHARHRPCDR